MKTEQLLTEHKKGVKAIKYAKKPTPLIGPDALKRKEDQKKKAAVKKVEPMSESTDDEENYYYRVRHQTEKDIELEMPSKAWDAVGPKYATYEEAKAAYENLKNKHTREKFTVTRHPRTSYVGGSPSQAFPEGVTEGDSGAKYKVRSIGHDAKGDYYISPSTGKKVYKKGVKVGDHENPKTGEHKGVAENKADGINKMFNNLGDPVYANLQRVALLAMQGRQQEASGRLQTVIKDADPDVQKKITDAVNNIKPVTINGKIADSSRLDKSKQHNDWIINTFIPWVQSLLGKQGVAEGKPKGYDSDGNPLGGGYDEYNNDKKSWTVVVDGKTWKTFDDERQAYKAADAIQRKYGKKTRVVSESITEGKIKINIKNQPETAQEKLYKKHQELRKKSGLPDPSEYKKKAAEKQKEIDDMKEAKQPEAPKPRNFVAKNAKTAGAGVHKDVKKAAKEVRGQKHKNKELAEAEMAKIVDYKPGQTATLNTGPGMTTIVDLKKNPTSLTKDPATGKLKLMGPQAQGTPAATSTQASTIKPGDAVEIGKVESISDILRLSGLK